MTLIISQNGKDAKRIARTSFGNEAELQQYIHENPEVIPLNDIDEDIRLLILAREFYTESGPIDAVGVDATGQLYLIETKLYKNLDKRYVVAQVLDYGASLWRHYNDFDSFRAALDGKVQEKWKMSLEEKLIEFFDLSPEEIPDLLSSMRNNLDEGLFKFVVLMDQLHDRLKDLLRFINRYSRFGFYAVEVEYYKHDSYEIMIPRLFGAEVKKDTDVSHSRERRTYTADWHFQGKAESLRPIYDLLEEELVKASSDIAVVPVKYYISVKSGSHKLFSIWITSSLGLYFSKCKREESITTGRTGSLGKPPIRGQLK
ncbi:hypothetical protein KKF55_06435 [Patescibacteria group bacterium]|nr:hypothetical protein [Patescibacteria group bacterium]